MTDPGPAAPAGRLPSGSARLARYAGLVGALLLTVAGWLGGALPGAAGTTPVGIWRGAYGPWILWCWLVGTVLLVGAWWSLRAGAPSTRWAYLTAGLWLLPLLAAPPLGSRDVYSYACQGWVYAAGADPYAAGVAELGCPWLDAVSPVWRDTPAPYGPFFVVLAGAAAALGGTLAGTIAVLRLFAVLGVLLAAACVPGLARSAGVPPERAAWLVLACPLVAVHLVAGAHNDAVMVGLLLAGLLLVVRRPGRRGALLAGGPLLAGGALLGLAVAVKATALVVLPFAVLAVLPAAVPGRHTVRVLLRDGGWVPGGALAALLTTSALSGLGLGWIVGLARSGDSEQWTSPPTALGFVVDYVGQAIGVDVGAVPVTRLLAVVLLLAVLVLLWFRAWGRLRGLGGVRHRGSRLVADRPQAAPTRAGSARTGAGLALSGAGSALAATVVLAPVLHPWYVTWPLAVLAVATTRTAWFVVPCAVVSFLTLPDGTNLARFSKAPGALLMTLLVVALLVRAVFRVGVRRRPADHQE